MSLFVPLKDSNPNPVSTNDKTIANTHDKRDKRAI